MANITLGTTLKTIKGEFAKVIAIHEKSKQAIIEFEDGKTRAYSFPTLKDKRKFTIIEDEEVQEPKAENENAEEAVSESHLVPMPGIEKLEELKKEVGNKVKSNGRKSLRLKEVTYKGETKSIREWAEETEIPWKTLYNRINNNGWPIDLALETPIGERKPKDKEA